MVRTVSRSPPAPCAGYLSVCPSCISVKVRVIANAQRAIEGCLTAIARDGNPALPGSSKRWPISPRLNRKRYGRQFGSFVTCILEGRGEGPSTVGRIEPVASLSNRRRQFAFGSDRAASEKWHKVGPCTAIRLKSD